MRCTESRLGGAGAWASVLAVGMILMFLGPMSAQGQDSGEAAAKALNPLSDIWSMQDQVNFNKLDGGPFPQAKWQFVNNFQPVMPVPLTKNINLVNRFVWPYVKNPYLDPGTGEVQYRWGSGDFLGTHIAVLPPYGLGTLGNLMFAAGVTYQIPASSSVRTGSGVTQFGPAAAVIFKNKKFIGGVFPQHWHSGGGTDANHPSQRNTNIQYFGWYFLTPTWTVGMAPNILIDWTKEPKNRHTVPIGIGTNYTFPFGEIHMKVQFEYHYAVIHPADIPGQRDIFRITITPVLPSPFAKKK